ncbi:SET domain-containing protein [Falsiroseomonas sp. HW251]|uniref:SET domain-containing protein n=1 Tax=Falsiroseomonas sp. HW251 TaxID=3390998 RepID=UPI003D3227B9
MEAQDRIVDARWRRRARLQLDPVKGKCVFAAEAIAAGDVIGYCDGPELDRDTVHSIHLGGKRIDPSEPFRFISHSCDPNAEFRDKGNWLHALKEIAAGSEITIDYLHTEPRISAPFLCRCGAASCRGMISTPANEAAAPRRSAAR